jgi:hypothetical protein
MVSRTESKSAEARMIRKNLALRFNTLYNCYEVYTAIHGTGVFRWMKITDEVCDWYKKTFSLTVTKYIQPSVNSGGIIEHTFQDKESI